tara:strand:- start:1069 stop:1299 length:231 start_codon:yes stop_codon:yes gene_type:complete
MKPDITEMKLICFYLSKVEELSRRGEEGNYLKICGYLKKIYNAHITELNELMTKMDDTFCELDIDDDISNYIPAVS